MPEEKEKVKGRYFYLMLKENFYDSDDMVLLESMPNGYKYSNILLKLYLRSLKDKGKLMYKDRIPYSIDMLAKLTRHDPDVVRAAVDIFQQMGIIEILDNGAIFMMDIENYIGKSSTEADRRRAYDRRIAAEKKQILLKNSDDFNSEKSCEKSHEHIEIELDTNIEDKIDIDSVDTEPDEPSTKNGEKEYLPPIGEFKNVLLTKEELQKITDKKLNEYIESLSTYLENNPKKKYNSHYATILTWFRRDEREKQSKTNGRQEIVPEWMNQKPKSEPMADDELKELRAEFSQFQDP